MTSNRLLKRLLGEDLNAQNVDVPSQQTPPPNAKRSDVKQMAQELDEPGGFLPPEIEEPEGQDTAPEIEEPEGQDTAPEIQGLADQWQGGDHVGVATKLMYTPLTHQHFVDLVFIIGQQAGGELAKLMDELAGGEPDQEGLPDEAPATPPQYSSALKRMTGGAEEEGVI